jgi:(p)ppGpp synthase/HD superfamily hydrolase
MNRLIQKAITYAADAHSSQIRKTSGKPYVSHPFEVGMILTYMGCPTNTICAGLLHDTIEDTNTTREDLLELFNEEIAEFVASDSENKKLSWEERKQQTIDSIDVISEEVLWIILADKLSNLRSLDQDLQLLKEEIWNVFRRGREQQKWYHESILAKLKGRIRELPNSGDIFGKRKIEVLEEYESLIIKVFK